MFTEKLKYMHANPVEKRLLLYPKDWPWSSWSHYAKGEIGANADQFIGGEQRKSANKDTSEPAPLTNQNPRVRTQPLPSRQGRSNWVRNVLSILKLSQDSHANAASGAPAC